MKYILSPLLIAALLMSTGCSESNAENNTLIEVDGTTEKVSKSEKSYGRDLDEDRESINLIGGKISSNEGESKESADKESEKFETQYDVSFFQKKFDGFTDGIVIDSIISSHVPGIVEVITNGGDPVYVTEDARFIINGNIFEIMPGGVSDIKNKNQEKAAKILLETTPLSDTVSYKSLNQKSSITVFTDVDCPYCKMLHELVPELNKQGISVNYMAAPMAGPESESANKMQAVWCSSDPKDAMDKVMSGTQIKSSECSNPVKDQYAKARSMGVNGTPTIIFSDGSVQSGMSNIESIVELALASELGD